MSEDSYSYHVGITSRDYICKNGYVDNNCSTPVVLKSDLSINVDQMGLYVNNSICESIVGKVRKVFLISLICSVTVFGGSHFAEIGFEECCSDYSQSLGIESIGINSNVVNIHMENNSFYDIKKVENLRKIKCMGNFQENWNGTGGRAFSKDSIELFEKVIEGVCKQPEIAPTGRDSLFMQYDLKDKSILAFEVKEGSAEKVFIPEGDYSRAKVEMITDNLVYNINNRVKEFYGAE